MTIHITPLMRGHAPQAIAFLKSQYGENFYGADERYFNWLYLKVPCRWFEEQAAKGAMPINAILGEEGELLAIHAYQPFDALTPWGGEKGVWDVEWINGSGLRGGGRALAAHLLEGVDVYAGFGCNDLSAAAFEKMGLTLVPEIHRLVFLLDRQALAGIFTESGFPEQAETLPPFAEPPCSPWRRLPGARDIPGEALKQYAIDTPLGCSRSSEWLDWRFDSHPYIRYHTITTETQGGGAAVVRLEQVHGTDVSVCRILEFFAMAERRKDLLTAVLGFARDQGCPLIDFFTASAAKADVFLETALSAAAKPLKNPPLPFRFQPLAFGPGNSINMVIASGGQARTGVDLADFHAAKCDSNQDIVRTVETAAVLGASLN